MKSVRINTQKYKEIQDTMDLKQVKGGNLIKIGLGFLAF